MGLLAQTIGQIFEIEFCEILTFWAFFTPKSDQNYLQFKFQYPHVEKTDNAPRKNTFPSSHSWHSAGVGVLFSSSFHTHSQRGCVWKEEEKKHLTPALGQEW